MSIAKLIASPSGAARHQARPDYRNSIIGRLAAEHCSDLSDESLERCLRPCVCGEWLPEHAAWLRDNNLLSMADM